MDPVSLPSLGIAAPAARGRYPQAAFGANACGRPHAGASTASKDNSRILYGIV